MSIFNSLKPDGGQKLRPFDLSRRDVFTAKSGVLNVNFVQHTIPESKYEVNHAQITRVDAIQTAPFARMSENYEYYFVPYSQIFHDFERLYYERGEEQRNYGNANYGSQPQVSLSVPTFSFSAVVYQLERWFYRSRLVLMAYQQNPSAVRSLLSGLFDQQDLSSLGSSFLPFDIHGEIAVDEMIKLFDMLGYGNLYAEFNLKLQSLFDFTIPALPSYTAANIGSVADAYNTSLIESLLSCFDGLVAHNQLTPSFTFTGKFADYANYIYLQFSVEVGSDGVLRPSYVVTGGNILDIFEFLDELVFSSNLSEFAYLRSFNQDLSEAAWYPSIMAIAAYQKVFSDIYRNTQFDINFYASLFNFDYIVDTQQSVVNINRVLAALMPRFRQYKKDVFTGVFPNAQFGSVAVSGLRNPSTINTADNAVQASNLYVGGGASGDNSVWYESTVESGESARFNINSGVSALAIRQALSLQRYKERILRAGNRLTALQNAVFGDRSRFLEDEYVQFIGAEKNNIDFNAVAATSDAGKSEVGQLGSNGVGTHVGKSFEFHSHDFGIIIGIYYILPESEYESFMIDPMNQKTETNDFYKPDFMNLGLSPVYNYQFNSLGWNPQDGDAVLGYLANYWEYKTSIDKVHGSFYCSVPSRVPVSQGVPSGAPSVKNVSAYYRGQNAYYVTPRSAQSFRVDLTLGNLYVNPHDIDSIFYVNSDFTMITDQFKVNCNHDVKALLPMSVVGLPEY